jgi:queuine tRNA-ribosyltransferase/7-cyano-7-deazaguanine tRNA-ribosyltransferase
MIEFSLVKKSKRSKARLGILKTPHGEVETPSLVPVATNATIKGMRSDEVLATKTQILISNTYHLHVSAGEKVIKDSGGINTFMNWPKPTMTDSGGFQVFSLGFGRDLGIGKFDRPFLKDKLEKAVEKGKQPKFLKITKDGVHFRSPLDGKELFLGPRESMAIQEKIGADIIFAFDECTPPNVTREYMEGALDRTHRWAKICIDAKKSKQALYGIVQGSVYKDMRQASAKYINKLGADGSFEGFGIGGDLGDSLTDSTKSGTRTVLNWTLPLLEEKKPRHLLGIGHLQDIENIIKCGVDTFDCTVPTHYARRGVAFISAALTRKAGVSSLKSKTKDVQTKPQNFARLDFRKAELLKDKNPVDPYCECLVCTNYKRNYIAHLIRANEITGGALLTFHNLFFFNTYVANLREKIRRGLL